MSAGRLVDFCLPPEKREQLLDLLISIGAPFAMHPRSVGYAHVAVDAEKVLQLAAGGWAPKLLARAQGPTSIPLESVLKTSSPSCIRLLSDYHMVSDYHTIWGYYQLKLVLDVARDIEELAPDAWFINVVNPVFELWGEQVRHRSFASCRRYVQGLRPTPSGGHG